jgi:hypothetical protein
MAQSQTSFATFHLTLRFRKASCKLSFANIIAAANLIRQAAFGFLAPVAVPRVDLRKARPSAEDRFLALTGRS